MKILKEPFFHFALLGIGIFVWFGIANPQSSAEPEANEIVVTEKLVRSLNAQYEAKLNRPPSLEDLQASIDRYINTEIMVREARALGIDQGDGIVRNRLVQKMGFLTSSAAQSVVPDDATLAGHLEENAERFARPAVVSFRQIGLREGLSQEDIAGILVTLTKGEMPDEEVISRLLPNIIDLATAQQVDGTFGRGFFAQITDLPKGQWAGPVQSGYGVHLIHVDVFQAASTPPLDEIRDKVLADWRRALAQQLKDAQETALRGNYVVTRPTQAQIEGWLDT